MVCGVGLLQLRSHVITTWVKALPWPRFVGLLGQRGGIQLLMLMLPNLLLLKLGLVRLISSTSLGDKVWLRL